MRNSYKTDGPTTLVELRRRRGASLWAVIDTTSLPKLLDLDCRWFAQYAITSPTYYAVALLGSKGSLGRKKLYMHRFLTGSLPSQEVDHENHDGLVNTKINLLVGNRYSNQQNRRGPRKGSASGVLNIIKSASNNLPWVICRMRNGVRKEFGRFTSVEEAVKALRCLR